MTLTGKNLPVSIGFSDASVASDGWEEVYDLEGNPTGMEVLEIGVRRLGLEGYESDDYTDGRIMLEMGDRINVLNENLYIDDVNGIVSIQSGWLERVVAYMLWIIMACVCLNAGLVSGLENGAFNRTTMAGGEGSGRETSGAFNILNVRGRNSGHETSGAFNIESVCGGSDSGHEPSGAFNIIAKTMLEVGDSASGGKCANGGLVKCNGGELDPSSNIEDANEDPQYDVKLGRDLSGIGRVGGNPSVELYTDETRSFAILEGEECARGVGLCNGVGRAKQAHVDGCSKLDSA